LANGIQPENGGIIPAALAELLLHSGGILLLVRLLCGAAFSGQSPADFV